MSLQNIMIIVLAVSISMIILSLIIAYLLIKFYCNKKNNKNRLR